MLLPAATLTTIIVLPRRALSAGVAITLRKAN